MTKSRSKKKLVTIAEELFIHSWWVAIFFLLCHLGYQQGLYHWQQDYKKLKQGLIALQEDREASIVVRDDLLHQINSQSDYAWIELTLLKGLGLVPEGQTKVYFKK